MKKRTADKFWFPWWPDKWIFGSIRIECTVEERAIWVDLLSLASKDDGYIRANEETPYPIEQLAGMLMVPQETLANAIEKFINLKDKDGKGKLTKTKFGTLYVTKWEKYQFTDRHKRRVMSGNEDMVTEKKDTILNKNKINNNKINNNNKYDEEFEIFWKIYPRKIEKKDAYYTWKTLTKKQKEEAIIGAGHYAVHCEEKQKEEEYIKHPKTFLNKKKERWKDWLQPKVVKGIKTKVQKELDDWTKKKDEED